MGTITYPEGATTWSVTDREAQKAFAAKLHNVAVDDLIVGVHIGPEESNGVGLPEDFEGLRPFHKVSNPTDGWNNGAKYVVYFENETAWNYLRAGRMLLFKGSTANYSMDRTQALSSLYLRIPNYASGNTKSYSCAGGAMTVQTYPSGRGFMSSGFMRTYDPITSLVFRNTGGNLAAGTVLVYGVK